MQVLTFLDRSMSDDTIVSLTGEPTGVSAEQVNQVAEDLNAVYKRRYETEAGLTRTTDGEGGVEKEADEDKNDSQQEEDTSSEEDKSQDESDENDDSSQEGDEGEKSDDDAFNLRATDPYSATIPPEGTDVSGLDNVVGSRLSFNTLDKTPVWMRCRFTYMTDIVSSVEDYGDGTNTHADERAAPGFADAGDVAILDSEIGPGGKSDEPGSSEYDDKRLEKVANGGAGDNDEEEGGSEEGGDEGGFGGEEGGGFGEGEDDGEITFHFDPLGVSSPETSFTPAVLTLSLSANAGKLKCTPVLVVPKEEIGGVSYHSAVLPSSMITFYPRTSREMKSAIDAYTKHSLISLRDMRIGNYDVTVAVDPDRYNRALDTITAAKMYTSNPRNWSDHVSRATRMCKVDIRGGIYNSTTRTQLARQHNDTYKFEATISTDNVLTGVNFISSDGKRHTISMSAPLVRRCGAEEDTTAYLQDVVIPTVDARLSAVGYLFSQPEFNYLLSCEVNRTSPHTANPVRAYAAMESFIHAHHTHPELASKVLGCYLKDSAMPNANTMGNSWYGLLDESTPEYMFDEASKLNSKMHASISLADTLADAGYYLSESKDSFKLIARSPTSERVPCAHWCHLDTTSTPIAGLEDAADIFVTTTNLLTKGTVGAFRLGRALWKKARNLFMRNVMELDKILKFYRYKLSTTLDGLDESRLDKFNATSLPREVLVNLISVSIDTFITMRNGKKVIFEQGEDLMPETLKKLAERYRDLGIEINYGSGDIKTSLLKDKAKHGSIKELGFDKTNVKAIVEQLLELHKYLTKEGTDITAKASEECAKAIREKVSGLGQDKNQSKEALQEEARSISNYNKRLEALNLMIKVVNGSVTHIVESVHNVFDAFESAVDHSDKHIGDIELIRKGTIFDKEKILRGDFEIKDA